MNEELVAALRRLIDAFLALPEDLRDLIAWEAEMAE